MEKKEAMKILKDFHDKSALFSVRTALHTIIPELRESEDERVRKAILELVRQSSEVLDKQNQNNMIAWLEKQGEEKSWKPSKEEMDVLYGLAYITNQYDEHKEEVITRLYQDLKREFFNGSSYENMFPTNTSTEDDVRRRSTIQVLEYARSLDTYNQYGKADIDKNIAWLEKQGEQKDNNKLIWKHWSGCGIAGNGDGTQIYLTKNYNTYSVCSCLSFECDYILLSDLDKLISDGDVDVRYKYLKDILAADDIYQMSMNDTMVEEAKSKASEALSKMSIGKLLGIKNQDEQKPINKIESKFHEGEWIVWQNKCYKVNDKGCGYELIDQNGLSTSLEYGTVDTSARLWDITKDAKDGDVLASNRSIFIFSQEYIAGKPEAHCGIMNGLFIAKPEGCWTNDECYPATKEQCYTLFAKMHEAGYEWDNEKKELKKISQRMVSAEAKEALYDKPTDEEMKELLRTEYEKGRADTIAETKLSWSEEDERMLDEIIDFFENGTVRLQHDLSLYAFWLKSLRPQNRWKPSDEQMEALYEETQKSDRIRDDRIVSLYNDLKKLKGE